MLVILEIRFLGKRILQECLLKSILCVVTMPEKGNAYTPHRRPKGIYRSLNVVTLAHIMPFR